MKVGDKIIITNLITGDRFTSKIKLQTANIFVSEEEIAFWETGRQYLGFVNYSTPRYSCEVVDVGVDPAVPGSDKTAWSVNGQPFTVEEMKHVFSQTIGFTIEFEQYSSIFKGLVTECDGNRMKMSLRKDGDWNPTLTGQTPCYAIQTIDFPSKTVHLFPGVIVSMNKTRNYE